MISLYELEGIGLVGLMSSSWQLCPRYILGIYCEENHPQRNLHTPMCVELRLHHAQLHVTGRLTGIGLGRQALDVLDGGGEAANPGFWGLGFSATTSWAALRTDFRAMSHK